MGNVCTRCETFQNEKIEEIILVIKIKILITLILGRRKK